MAEEIVKVIKIETGSSERSINSLKADIKSLTKELNSLTIGSERYNKVQADLVNKTTQLKEINSSMRIQTRTLQQDLNNLQKFAVGVTSGFTALTGVLALVGTDSEDFNKTIQKLTASLTVLNSVGGLKDLVESLPGLKDAFKSVGDSIKNFFSNAVNSFDPLERRLTQAANNLSGIGNIDIKADIKTSGAPIAAVSPTVNSDLQAQENILVPVNDQWDKYNKELVEAKTLAKDYSADLEKLRNIFQDYNVTVPKTVVPLKEFDKAAQEVVKGNLEPMKEFLETLKLDDKALTEVASKMGVTYNQLNTGIQNFKENIQEDAQYVQDLKDSLSELESAGGKTGTAFKKLGGIFKSVFSTVGWTLLITAIITLISKVIDYVKELNKATKAQKLFNQEVNKTTAEISSSSITKFIELQKAYKAVGDTADEKKQFIKDYADALKETGLKITDVQTAEDAFINNTEKYKQAIIARAKIDAYREQITKKTKEYIENMLELDRQLESGEWKKLTAGQSIQVAGVGAGVTRGTRAEQIANEQSKGLRRQFETENIKKIQEQRKTYESEYNKFVSDILTKQTDLEKTYSGLWTDTVKTATTQTIKEVKDNLPDLDAILQPIMDEINQFIEAEYDVLLGDRDKELRDLENNWFKPYLELYKEYGGDVENLLEEYGRRKKAIIDKYNPKKDYTEQLNAIKELYDRTVSQLDNTQKLTTYKRFGYTFQYESKDDAKANYKKGIDNAKTIYNATLERINAERQLYKQAESEEIIRAQNSVLTEEEKNKQIEDIKEKYSEKNKKLSKQETDAKLAYDQALIEEEKKLQQKRLNQFQASVQVTSSVLGSLGSIYDTKAQTAKSEKEMKKASKTAKGFKAAQAVIDALSAANGAYAAMSSIYGVGPALGAAAAAAALIAGYANVKSILAQDVTGSSVQNVTANVPSASTPNISYTKELLGDKELDVVNQPIKCYVVESDITSTQNRIKTQVTNSTF